MTGGRRGCRHTHGTAGVHQNPIKIAVPGPKHPTMGFSHGDRGNPWDAMGPHRVRNTNKNNSSTHHAETRVAMRRQLVAYLHIADCDLGLIWFSDCFTIADHAIYHEL